MPLLAALLLDQAVAGATAVVPACTARQLMLAVDGKDGQFAGMQKSGTELSIRNDGAECLLPALPRVAFLDARGRVLPVNRRAPVGMHPGPVMLPLRLGAGQRAVTDLTWIAGPVYARNRPLAVRYLRVSLVGGSLRARLSDVINTRPGTPGGFDQPPLRPADGATPG